MSIIEKVKGNKKVKAYLAEGEEAKNIKSEFINTGNLPLNILYSGRLDGGIPTGKISVIAGESSTSKSMQSLMIARNAIKKGFEVVYIDTEYALNDEMLANFGLVDKDEFLLVAENMIGDIKEFLMNFVQETTAKERSKILFIIDSWGMLTNGKSVDDAVSGKDVADLQTTRAKNSLAVLLNQLLPGTVFVSNHVYESMSMFGGKVMSGGSKLLYVASSIVQTTSMAKQKEGDGEISGKIVTAKTLKSRFCKPETKLKFLIDFTGGLHPYFGILDDALQGKYVVKPSNGWYTRPHIEDDKKWREKEIWENSREFWLPVLKETDFKSFIEQKYSFKFNEIHIEDIDF